MCVKHNHQKIYINLKAEARVRCWAGNTHIEGLIDPADVKTHHHRTVAALDHKLRGAIQALEKTTKAGKTEITKSRTGVDDVEPDDVTLVESCLKQVVIWQDAVLQAVSRAAATVFSSDTHVTAKQDEAGRMEKGATDNANISIGDTHVISNQHEAERMEKKAADTDKIPATDTHITARPDEAGRIEKGAADNAENPTNDTDLIMNQFEAGRKEKGAVDATETATIAAGQGGNTSADVLSPLLASKSVHSETMTDSHASHAGEQAEDCDWDLVDATEAVQV